MQTCTDWAEKKRSLEKTLGLWPNVVSDPLPNLCCSIALLEDRAREAAPKTVLPQNASFA